MAMENGRARVREAQARAHPPPYSRTRRDLFVIYYLRSPGGNGWKEAKRRRRVDEISDTNKRSGSSVEAAAPKTRARRGSAYQEP